MTKCNGATTVDEPTNQRQHKRTPVRFKLKIWHPLEGEALVETRDVSDGGVFLLMDNKAIEMHSVGTIIKGQIQGMMEDAPVITMEVVRTTGDGVGLRYILDAN